MVFSILSAAICFIAAIIMLTPYFRKMALLTPMAIYLAFQGVMQLITYIILDVYPTNRVVIWINCIGTSIIIAYYCFVLIMTKSKSRKKRERKER